MSRRPIVIAVLVLLGAAGADAVAWRVATVRLAAAYGRWQAGLARAGWQVSAAAPVASGWPVAALLRLDGMRLGQVAPGGVAWTASRVVFGVSLLHPRTLVVVPGGAQTLSGLGLGLAPVGFAADRLRASAPLESPIRSARARAAGLVVRTRDGPVSVQRATLDVSWRENAARLVVQAGPATLPPGHRWGLGTLIAGARLELVAHGAWPEGAGQVAAARWRDAGGRIDVADAQLQWGALRAVATGRVGLDQDAQPAAALNVRLSNPQAALASLAESGAVTPGAAMAIGAVLSLLSLPARLAGRADVVELPVSVRDGAVAVGQIPVVRVPLLQWRDGSAGTNNREGTAK